VGAAGLELVVEGMAEDTLVAGGLRVGELQAKTARRQATGTKIHLFDFMVT
jgi:hypothetical protein